MITNIKGCFIFTIFNKLYTFFLQWIVDYVADIAKGFFHTNKIVVYG